MLILPKLRLGRGTARRSRAVEGQARPGSLDNAEQHTLHVSKHFSGRDPHREDAMSCQQRVALSVGNRIRTTIMTLAIDPDAKPCGRAVEIERERTGGMLMPEFQAARSLAQL